MSEENVLPTQNTYNITEFANVKFIFSPYVCVILSRCAGMLKKTFERN